MEKNTIFVYNDSSIYQYAEKILTSTPASIDESVFLWYSGLNQKHDVKVSIILIVPIFLCTENKKIYFNRKTL